MCYIVKGKIDNPNDNKTTLTKLLGRGFHFRKIGISMKIKRLLKNSDPNTIVEILDANAFEQYVYSKTHSREEFKNTVIIKARYEDLYSSKILDELKDYTVKHCYTPEENKRKIIVFISGREDRIKKLKNKVNNTLVSYFEGK